MKRVRILVEHFRGEICPGVFANGPAGTEIEIPDEALVIAKKDFPGWFEEVEKLELKEKMLGGSPENKMAKVTSAKTRRRVVVEE